MHYSSLIDIYVVLISELTQDNFKIVLDIPSAPTAGEVITLSCTVVPPDRSVLNLDSILWAYDAAGTDRVDMVNPDATLGPLVSEAGGNFSRNITLDPVKTSDARRYFCDYAIGVINTGDFADLTVQSKYMYMHMFMLLYYNIVPSPDVSVSRSPSSGPIYESTVLNLTCTATVPSVVDTAVSAAVVWTNVSSDTDYLTFLLPQQVETNKFESILMFNPVDIDNMEYGGFYSAGNYECQITVSDDSSPDNGEILDGVGSNDFDFIVDGKLEMCTQYIYVIIYSSSSYGFVNLICWFNRSRSVIVYNMYSDSSGGTSGTAYSSVDQDGRCVCG